MSVEAPDSSQKFDRWQALLKREAAIGETRLNLIRLCAVLGFYAYHLINFYWLAPGTIELTFHTHVSALVLAWASEVVLLYLCASRNWLTIPQVKYSAIAWDCAMITCLLMLRDRPEGAFILFYLLVIGSSCLRLALKPVYFATLASVLGYGIALGHYVFVVVGYEAYYATPSAHLSRTEQVIVLLSLFTAGFVAGQVVRQFQRTTFALAAMGE